MAYYVLFLWTFILSSPALAIPVVTKVKDKRVLLQLQPTDKLQVGEKHTLISYDGKEQAQIVITQVKGNRALAEMTSGQAKVGSRVGKPKSEGQWNFRFSPIWVLVGWYHLNLDYKILGSTTLGIAIDYINPPALLGVSTLYKAYGIEVNHHFAPDAFLDGAVLGLMAGSVTNEVKVSGILSAKNSASGTYYGVLGGYQWYWSSFNMKLSAGQRESTLAKSGTEGSLTIESRYFSGSETVLDFHLGFKF